MEVEISPQRHAQLSDYAQRHGQDAATALDEVLASALEWERLDFHEAVEGIRHGYEDMKAGRTQSAEEMFEELRVKLSEAPGRCRLAPEDEMFSYEVRQLLYGKRFDVYRILFTVEGDTVTILHIQHGRRVRLGLN